MSESSDKLQVGAYFMLAGGFILSALANIKNARDKALGNVNAHGLGDSPGAGISSGKGPRVLQLPSVRLPTSLGKPKLKQYDVKDIDTRVGLIGELIRKGSLSPDLRERTVALLASKCDALGRLSDDAGRFCVAEKDCLGEVKAIFEAIRNPRSKYAVRYTRDAMLADVFVAPERTLLKSHGGDCDDSCIVLGSMLMSVGHPVRLRIVATRQDGVADSKAPWSHIYLLTPTTFDNPNAKWLSVDGSMDKPLGWEAPGAREVAATGKPSGIIARVRDYSLMKPSDAE